MTACFLEHTVANMKATDIIDALGEDAICQRLGIKRDAVRKAYAKNKLPAPWFAALEDMMGRELPPEIFSFKGLDAT